MKEDQIPVNVRILDKEYRIACLPEEQDGLLSAAQLLDRRMREIRQTGRVIGGDRIAVLAALNVIYELMQQHTRERRTSGGTLDRIQRLQQRIEWALGNEGQLDAGQK